MRPGIGKIEKFTHFLVKYFIREYKIQVLSLQELTVLLRDCELPNTCLQQLLHLLLNQQGEECRYFTFPTVQYLLMNMFESPPKYTLAQKVKEEIKKIEVEDEDGNSQSEEEADFFADAKQAEMLILFKNRKYEL